MKQTPQRCGGPLSVYLSGTRDTVWSTGDPTNHRARCASVGEEEEKVTVSCCSQKIKQTGNKKQKLAESNEEQVETGRNQTEPQEEGQDPVEPSRARATEPAEGTSDLTEPRQKLWTSNERLGPSRTQTCHRAERTSWTGAREEDKGKNVCLEPTRGPEPGLTIRDVTDGFRSSSEPRGEVSARLRVRVGTAGLTREAADRSQGPTGPAAGFGSSFYIRSYFVFRIVNHHFLHFRP